MQVELTISQPSVTSKKGRSPAVLLVVGIGSLLLVAALCTVHMGPATNSNRSLLEVSSSSSTSSSSSSSNTNNGGSEGTQEKVQDIKVERDGDAEENNQGKEHDLRRKNHGNNGGWNTNGGYYANNYDTAPTSGSTYTVTYGNTKSGNSGTINSGTSGTTNNGGSSNTANTVGSVLTYTPNEKCTNGKVAYLTGLTAEQKAELLKAHNDFRSQIALGKAPGQPGASDMLEMIWDDDVAARAQAWADNCVFEHDNDAGMRTSKFKLVGQNLGIEYISKKLSKIDLTAMVKDLYDEVKLYGGRSAPVDSYQFDEATGHYTQIAWAKSYALGCGFKVYAEQGMYTYQLTCNYGPAGNFVGEKMYTRGTFNAAKCKNGASTTYEGLCKI